MILTAQRVSVTFGRREVLAGLSIDIDAGQRWALTGRSGSGKTTALLVLAGLLAPTSGSVVWLQPRERLVYVPQAPSLVGELTALQNASLGLRVRGVSPDEAEERGRRQLRALGLEDADEALPAELSGGMQQRVALARALAIEPLLLLADEPTGALDRATGAQVLKVLSSWAETAGSSVVIATHDFEVAAQLDRRIELGTEVPA